MKTSHVCLLAALAAFLVTGCISTDPQHFTKQVHEWVPLGMSVTDAKLIMQSHKFECRMLNEQPGNPSAISTLSCVRKNSVMTTIADWHAEFDIRDGKVVGYGYINL